MITLVEIRKIIKFIEEYGLKIRVKLYSKDKITNWSGSLTEPSIGYLDIGIEPMTPKEIEFIELNCIVVKKIGRLVPDKIIDKEQVVAEHLTNNNLHFSLMGNGIIRIQFDS